MLEAYKNDSGITEVYERAGLPVDRGRRIADLLLRYGPLLELREGRGKYRITPKGDTSGWAYT